MTDSDVNENVRAAIGREGYRADRTTYSVVGARPHELHDELGQRGTLEHGADAFGDRQLDAEAVRDVAQHGRRRQTLDDHADLGDGLLASARPGRSALRRGGCGPSAPST